SRGIHFLRDGLRGRRNGGRARAAERPPRPRGRRAGPHAGRGGARLRPHPRGRASGRDAREHPAGARDRPRPGDGLRHRAAPVARFADAEELGRALAAEERRGTVAPLAVRAFLTESAHLSVLALVYCALLGIFALPATAAAFLWSGDPILRSMALGGLIVLLL